MTAWAGLRLAVTWLTVVPVRADRLDVNARRWAIALSPVVGGGLGLVLTGVWFALSRLDAPPALVAVLVVAASGGLTRGMHLDGLADVADGLGCHPPERALAVMRDGAAGPFAVVTLIITVVAQVLALAELAADHRWWVLVLAFAVGRASFAWCCRAGVPAARPDGLGAMVAGTQPRWVAGLWLVPLTGLGAVITSAPGSGAAVTSGPGAALSGVVAVLVAAAVTVEVSRRTTRRFGGLTGDVLGAAAELSTTSVLVTVALL